MANPGPATPDDAMNTADILKHYFALFMELNSDDIQLPEGKENRAFVSFLLADTKVAIAESKVAECVEILDRIEGIGPTLQAHAKDDQKASSIINTNFNRMQQQKEQLKKLEAELRKLAEEKPNEFRKSLDVIRKGFQEGYEQTKMTKIELDRHLKTLELIEKKFKQAEGLHASFKESGAILDDYFATFEQQKMPRERKREEAGPEKPAPKQ